MPNTESLAILAPAKVNLYLEIVGRRPDGYHDIESIMHTVSLYDRIMIEPADKLVLECYPDVLPTDEKNLAFRAARMLQEKLGVSDGAHIVLEKHIPMGAGLGGGSSDAAAVLKGLLKLWKKHLSMEELVPLAVRLGADVPFFLQGGTAFATGIGDRLFPLNNVAPACFLLINPRFPVATPWVYKQLRLPLTNPQKSNTIKRLLTSGRSATEWGGYLFNRLEEPVLPAFSEIFSIKNTLSELGYCNLMSGSGSTVFALIPSEEIGAKVKSELSKFSWDVWVVTSVP